MSKLNTPHSFIHSFFQLFGPRGDEGDATQWDCAYAESDV